jgi:hypothetical protein
MIKARVRMDSCWSDACILNLSRRGMLVRAPNIPAPGTYLEVRRGAHVIVARVIWSTPDRFGVQTQDPVPAEALIRDPDRSSPPVRPGNVGIDERRAQPRHREAKQEASRHQGQAMEFGVLIAIGAIAAFLIGGSIVEAFADPLNIAETTLAAN